jgi:hypothetical protein
MSEQGKRQRLPELPSSEEVLPDDGPRYWIGAGATVRMVTAAHDFIVRLELDDKQRWRAVDLMTSGSPLNARHLASIPIEALEAWANGPGETAPWRIVLELHGGEPGLRYATEVVRLAGQIVHWSASTTPLPLLVMPERVDDDFLESVAAHYLAFVANGGRDFAPYAAGLLHVSNRTVHGWVRKARERGYLPPGRRGVVG